MSLALIALGGNLGDVVSSFQFALDWLDELGTIQGKSSLYRTIPVGVVDAQEDYLNAVVSLETTLVPEELLEELLNIEHARGRERFIKNGARTLDLDLLAYDDLVLNTERLTLPHPRMWERAFVLKPLGDILPDWVHPLKGQKVWEAVSGLDLEGVELEAEVW
ncbi:2-amino-4-hydroxy-6-hydroxymethyldihydropteridine diphosphokinase [Deinococcus cellulosilyticus]|uniref:2-amino-4-hydroxy-6-hydroxymethyldihydropteridine diphosphokinase n=1 Tax=Deinococcus cellulosilyticus (strain DSM 18568 / NBRC 106333 / KACC 11606 / 5516J-15) TaxID=1223518 RepID=A0A511N8N4_DEIC1|nr:2-amino-4-hydroxy-6-hydroxymethyldihydropteridine diphosphokinase [Deinococcus cellulosilyticus]GEM49205.1 2-amino-4-hydroxy-6-hydroxymethyldihydropteridine diphosphokinase [Deinococcus cellulosilyticus NBRC 106333 = KACC 11606]